MGGRRRRQPPFFRAPPQFAIVTVSDAPPKLLLPSVQLTHSVCTPLLCRVESHLNVALVAVVVTVRCPLVEATGGPPESTANLKPFVDLPLAPITLTVTETVPLTVESAAGPSIVTLSLPGCTVMVRVGGLGSLTPLSSTVVNDAT